MSETPSRAGSTPPNKAQVDADAKAAEEAKVAEEAKAAEEAKQAKAAAAKAQAQAAQDEAPAEPEGQDVDDPKFTIADLVANARTLTGYGKYVLAGALSKLEGDSFTIAEAKAAAEGFAATPIDPEVPDNLTNVDPVSGAFTVEPTAPAAPDDAPAEES